jgi:hypothetical protein
MRLRMLKQAPCCVDIRARDRALPLDSNTEALRHRVRTHRLLERSRNSTNAIVHGADSVD